MFSNWPLRVAWLPDKHYSGEDRFLLCRGFECGEPGFGGVQFEPDHHPTHQALINMNFGPLDAEPLWSVLTQPMADWENASSPAPSSEYQTDLHSAFRPLFSAPLGWTPAPDGTLAAAMLRSLAYGDGPERLDEKLIVAINQRVRCLDEMKRRLERGFIDGLERHGYGDD